MAVRSRRLLALALLVVLLPHPAQADEAPAPVLLPGDDSTAALLVWQRTFDPFGRDHDTSVVVRSRDEHPRTVAVARANGATVVELPSGDPRTRPEVVPAGRVLAVGMPRGFAYALDVVRRGAEQQSGGYHAMPGKHYVALYGHPGAPQLGVLGEQGPEASVERVKKLAASYRAAARKKVEFVPTFEIITTVAAAGKGKDGDYSREAPIKDLLPMIDAAEKAGVYVILDLQPGRADFLAQAKEYEPLLRRPHVGLALDPEWRLTKKQKPLQQIGSVKASEINRTSTWLAALTRKHHLPQKLFVLHQFSTSMITDRSRVDTSHPELATVIHVDGSGPQGAKRGTWNHLRQDPPPGLAGWGWKNFIDEDEPILTADQTWRRVKPHPDLITYQ